VYVKETNHCEQPKAAIKVRENLQQQAQGARNCGGQETEQNPGQQGPGQGWMVPPMAVC